MKGQIKKQRNLHDIRFQIEQVPIPGPSLSHPEEHIFHKRLYIDGESHFVVGRYKWIMQARGRHIQVEKNTLVICSCTKTKNPSGKKVSEIYQSQILNEIIKFQKKHGYKLMYLSAKHGLLYPEDEITPYDQKLSGKYSIIELEMKIRNKIYWLKRYSRILLIMGKKYEESILHLLRYHPNVWVLKKPNGIFDYKKNLKKLNSGDYSVLEQLYHVNFSAIILPFSDKPKRCLSG